MWWLVWDGVWCIETALGLIMTGLHWVDTHACTWTQNHMYKLHETLRMHDILTYIHTCMGKYIPTCRDWLTCTQGDNWWRTKFFISPSHAMSLAVMAYMNWWQRSFYTKFPPTWRRTFMSRAPKRDNFPGNSNPYTVAPSAQATGSINDTRSCIHVVAGLGWRDA